MLNTIASISLSMSAIIVLLLVISPFLNKNYTAKWHYFVWLFVAIRLIIPFNFTLPKAPVQINPPPQTVVFKPETNIPFAVMDDSYKELGNQSSSSIDYTPIMSVQQLLTIIWAVGAFGFLLYHFIEYALFRRRIKPWCKDSKMEKRPKVLVCKKIQSPMLIGFFKPVILLPDNNYSADDMAVIIKHELTHYKRGDIWYKLILVLANAVHWFNPLVYVMARAANRDLELSCDDEVVRNKDIEFRKAYSTTILNAVQVENATQFSTYFKGGKSTMKQRFSNILDMSGKKKGVLAFTIIFVIMVIAGALVACNQEDQADEFMSKELAELASEWYQYKSTSINDNENLIKIFNATPILLSTTIENITVYATNGINVYCTMNEPLPMRLNAEAPYKYAAIAFSLIDDADEITFIFNYKGITTSYTYTRDMIASALNVDMEKGTQSENVFKDFVYKLRNSSYSVAPIVDNGREFSYKSQTTDCANYHIANAYSRYYDITKVEIQNYNSEINGDEITATFNYIFSYKKDAVEIQQIFDIKFTSKILEGGFIDTNAFKLYGKTELEKDFVPIETFYPKGESNVE